MNHRPWIGVDLDGSLAYSGTKVFDGPIGVPIPRMVRRVRDWLEAGYEVRIFTARVAPLDKYGFKKEEEKLEEVKARIRSWCKNHLKKELDIVCEKDENVLAIWDDRAVQLIKDTGKSVGEGFPF